MSSIDQKILSDRLHLLQLLLPDFDAQLPVCPFSSFISFANGVSKDENGFKNAVQKLLIENQTQMNGIKYKQNQTLLQLIKCSKCKKELKYHLQVIPCEHQLCQECCQEIHDKCPCCKEQIESLTKLKKTTEIINASTAECDCGWEGAVSKYATHKCHEMRNSGLITINNYSQPKLSQELMAMKPNSSLAKTYTDAEMNLNERESFVGFVIQNSNANKILNEESSHQAVTPFLLNPEHTKQQLLDLLSSKSPFKVEMYDLHLIEGQPHGYYTYLFKIWCGEFYLTISRRFNDFKKLNSVLYYKELPKPQKWWYFGGSELSYAQTRHQQLCTWLCDLLNNQKVRKSKIVVQFLGE
ncbi:PX_domain-containing protein [Hexamita inflata]|uniref:PX domain-containing protein n=1 Tax=Hexamita inflata TaxID=28002 RepID=A0AA86PPH1_9EUKA|nr:PX domain-containing protein [Hexamita inflata]